MLRLRDILNVLARKGNAGASIDDFRNEFGDDEMDDIKRLVQAALDLQEIKKDGKSRGVRYYLFDVQIPEKIRLSGSTAKRIEGNFVEGVIDISGCNTVKEKVDKIIESEHKLQGIHAFSYRRKNAETLYNRELYDHINHGAVDVDIRLGNKNGKNAILSKKERFVNNKISIYRNSEGEWIIEKIHYECPDRPDILRFTVQSEFEKCLKTLHKS